MSASHIYHKLIVLIAKNTQPTNGLLALNEPVLFVLKV